MTPAAPVQACPHRVVDYASARAVLTHHGLTRSPRARGSSDPLDRHILNLEGADHVRMRTALTDALDRHADAAVPRLRALARRLVAGLDGGVDVAARIVEPLVLDMLDRAFGLRDVAPLGWWLQHAVDVNIRGAAAVTPAVRERAAELLDLRRRERTAIVAAIASSAATPADATATALFAIHAAFTNTSNLLGISMLALAAHPHELDRLRGTPSLIPNATEELLRFCEPPRRSSFRVATTSVTIGPLEIEPGQRVEVMKQRANRDPDRFAEPERLDVGRADASAHLSFGHGRHRCAGTRLGRAALDQLLIALVIDGAVLTCTSHTPRAWDVADRRPLPLAFRRRAHVDLTTTHDPLEERP